MRGGGHCCDLDTQPFPDLFNLGANIFFVWISSLGPFSGLFRMFLLKGLFGLN